MMKGDIFKGVKQWDTEIDGARAKRPLFFYDSFSMQAIYTASTKKVLKYIPHPDMHPIELVPGRCLVVFTAFEYRESDIGPYNEFSIAIVIKWGGKVIPALTMLKQMMSGNLSGYVWHLPVTTEIARHGGVVAYGLPKFRSDIDFKNNGQFIECELSEGKNKILNFRGKILKTSKGKSRRFKTYSLINGITLVTNIHTSQIKFAKSSGKDSASIEIGDSHKICHELRDIDLGKGPLLYQYVPVSQSILFPAKNIMDN
jgi:hypothetical protein